MKADLFNRIFQQSILDYHKADNVDVWPGNPYAQSSIEHLAYKKNSIDTIQWHLEDIVRRPDLSSEELVAVKRRIDRLNQERTDTVEQMDDYFLDYFSKFSKKATARMHSETPAWLLDRMSILCLKIYHMDEQTKRTDAPAEHIEACKKKLFVLLEQQRDMAVCFDELAEDIRLGDRFMKVYRQMKMYNDPSLNPALYGAEKSK